MRFALLCGFVLAAFVSVAGAQTVGGPSGSTSILTLNQDRFFKESDFGKRVLHELEQRSADLTEENHRIEEELKAEEQALTEKRKTLPASDFRILADAFDEKVQNIRKQQAQKAVDLSGWTEGEQQVFFKKAFGELLKLATELGADVILDQRTTIISSGRVDVTDRAIARVNSVIGDGTEPAKP